MKKSYGITLELDVQTRDSARGVVEFDGVSYAVTVVPAHGPSGERRKRLDDSTFGEETISLGPRGSRCPTCGR